MRTGRFQRRARPSAGEEYSHLLGYPLGFSGDPRAEACVCVQGHPEIVFDLHLKPEAVLKTYFS